MNRKEFDMGEDRKEAQFRKMTGEKIPGLIFTLAVPTIISMIVTAIYNTADTYFVSKLGTSASGAVGIVMIIDGADTELRLHDRNGFRKAGCPGCLERKRMRRLPRWQRADFIFRWYLACWLQ